MKIKPPCGQECQERCATCHTTCEAWKRYEADRDAEYAERDKRRQGTYSTCDRRMVNAKYKFIIKSGKDVKTW